MSCKLIDSVFCPAAYANEFTTQLAKLIPSEIAADFNVCVFPKRDNPSDEFAVIIATCNRSMPKSIRTMIAAIMQGMHVGVATTGVRAHPGIESDTSMRAFTVSARSAIRDSSPRYRFTLKRSA